MGMSIRSAWPQLVGRAWADETFLQQLMANPTGVLREMGVDLPPDHKLEVLQDTPDTTFLVMPKKPADLDSLASPIIRSTMGYDSTLACTPGSPIAACTPGPIAACTPGADVVRHCADACTFSPVRDAVRACADACTFSPIDACTFSPQGS